MLSKFDYYKPDNLADALDYLETNPAETRILAGGTDLMILLRRNAEICDHILDIKGIKEAKELNFTNEGLFIGAAITVNEISENKEIREKYPALCEAADSLASYQIRNRATVVGNICNASPGADLAPPLLVYNAKLHIASKEENREVELKDFFTGVKKTVLKPNEIVVGVSIPDVVAGDDSLYLRKTRIKGHDLCNVGIAFRLTDKKEVFMAVAAVNTTPLRLFELEESIASRELNEELGEFVQTEIKKYMKPRKNSIRSSPEYRLHTAGVLAKKGVLKLIERGAR